MKKAIVLGGTDDHLYLIEILKSRGYYTILVDYFENPPAKGAADEHIQKSTLDKEEILLLASNLKVNLIISACVDQALLTACYVAEKLDLPAPFGYRTALNVTNKAYMKKRMTEADIPTAYYRVVNGIDQSDFEDLNFPVIVKPADSNGSFGVRRVSEKDDLLKYLSNAIRISRTNKAIIENYQQGQEVSIDVYLGDCGFDILMVGNLRKKRIGEHVDLIFQNVIPADISKKAFSRINDIVRKIAVGFELKNTPLLVQAIVNGDDVSVIEFSPRIGGGSKHKTIQFVTGFDIVDSLVDSYLGITPKVRYNSPACYFSRNHIYAEPGIFGEVKNVDCLLQTGIIEDFNYFKAPGMEIGNNYASKDRVGSFLVKADSLKELYEKIEIAVSGLDVFDIKGNSIMRKDVFRGDFL